MNQTGVVGGAEWSLLDLIDHLPEGVAPTLLCPAGELADVATRRNVPWHAIPSVELSLKARPRSTIAGVIDLMRAVRGIRSLVEGCDVVHANSVRAGVVALITVGGRAPVVVNIRECLPPSPLAKLTTRFVVRRAAAMVANSRHTAERFRVLGGKVGTTTPIDVVRGPVDVQRFSNDSTPAEATRAATAEPERRAAMGRTARDRATRRFEVGRAAGQTVGLWRRVAPASRNGTPLPPVTVSVVIPSLGRPTLVPCLQSISACKPQPDEVVVVIQGEPPGIEDLVARHGPPGATVVRDMGWGVARSSNAGLQIASGSWVLVTHDDCTVTPDWVHVARGLASQYHETIITGRVRPVGDPSRVPSWKDAPSPYDYTGEVDPGALYPNNMLLPRERVLSLGGFDERFGPDECAEDGDFAYRWLRGGFSLRYEPRLTVDHHDWRTNEQLERLYLRYARGLGAFYGKYLRLGDLRAVGFLLRATERAGRGVAAGILGKPRWADWRQALPRALPGGLWFGLRRLDPTTPRLTPRAPFEGNDRGWGPKPAESERATP